MNLIDTYVSEVGRHLPQKNRADIEAEIRSTIEDILEERSRKFGKPADDELTYAVLKEYGSPEHVAASYLPERYLIGPRLYPIFLVVIRIVLIVIGVLALIGLGIALGQTVGNARNVFEIVVKAVAEYGASAMSVLGNVVLIFALLEWALYRAGEKIEVKGFTKEKEWDPRSLTRLSPPDRVKRGETIAEIVFSFAAIVIFNFYPQLVGFTPSLNSVVESGNWQAVTFIPILSEAFFRYVPFLTTVWGLTIMLDIVLLRQGFWNTLTRWFSVGLKLVGIGIAAGMLAGPSLVAITTESLTASLHDAEAAGILFTLITQVVRIGLVLAILFGGLDVVKAIIHQLKQQPSVIETS
jgi:hypothetical protein